MGHPSMCCLFKRVLTLTLKARSILLGCEPPQSASMSQQKRKIISPERELLNNHNDRRSFMKLLAAAPLFATIGTRRMAAAVAATATKAAEATGLGHSFTSNVYTRLGVQPLINGLGTYTYVGG